jgi:hypothetical protein
VGAKRFHTFLSYNSSDQLLVERLAHALQGEGIQVWLDQWNLVPGKPWQAEIEQALQDCETCSVLIGPSGFGPWQHAEMRAAIDRQISRNGFRVIPVLLPGAERGERSHYPAFLTQTTWVEFRNSIEDPEAIRRLRAGIRGVAPGSGVGHVSSFCGCPYRGLQTFDVEHARLFFGREALTEWLVNALRGQPRQVQAIRFLAVVGASGSGKSSLVRAGLIPAIQHGALPESESWPVLIIRPGPAPFESLAVALKKDPVIGNAVGDVGDLKARLSENVDRLHLTVRLALSSQPDLRRAVLVVDQFEEVFTLCRNPGVRKAFVEGLIYAATEASGQTIVLVTMRADFYGKCAPYEGLAAALSDHQILVGPMSDQELHEAIVGPARLTGCEFDPGLVEMLVEDVKGEAGGLPLLEYTLAQLWERCQGRQLTVAAYNDLGRLAGALEKRANELYDAFSTSEKEACKQIFLRLTQPGEGTEDTKRRAYRSEMSQTGATDQVLQALTEARLVTAEGEEGQPETFVEVSHEALIRGWPRLRQWIDENRDALRLRTRLAEAAREWDRRGRTEARDYVYRGTRLAEAQEWAKRADMELSALERGFLDASVAVRDEEQRESLQKRRRRMALSIALIGLVGVLTGAGLFQYTEAQRSKARLAETLIATQAEAQRTDLLGSVTVFATSYGQAAREVHGRGLFTSLLERHLFTEYTSVSRAIALAQSELLSRSGSGQRAEVLSNMNGEVFLNPRNERRRFWGFVAGWDHYQLWPRLQGAVADAKSIYSALRNAGYSSRFIANASAAELETALTQLLSEAEQDCKTQVPDDGGSKHNVRGFVPLKEINPCDNVLVFVYFAGHGFVSNGTTYLVLGDAELPDKLTLSDRFLSIEALRGRIAERVGAQIIIADISRATLQDR